MKKKVMSITLALALTLSLLLSACGGQASNPPAGNPSSDPAPAGSAPAEPISIIFGNYGNSAMPPAKSDLDAIAYVEEQTGGAIQYDYVPDGVLGGESDMMQQIMDGTIQAAIASCGTLSMYTNISEVIQLPFLIGDYETEYAALSSDAALAIYEKIGEDLGIKIVWFSENGMRHFANNVRPINTLDDLNGLKLRIAPSNMLTEVLTNLKASPVTVPYNEVYSALQNKVVDGEEINITSIYALKHYEVLKYISEVGMYPFPCFAVYNLDFWNSLTAEQQQIITDGHKLGAENLFQTYLPEYEAEAIAACKEYGLEFNSIDDAAKEEFRNIAQSTWDSYRSMDPLMAEFIDYVQSLK